MGTPQPLKHPARPDGATYRIRLDVRRGRCEPQTYIVTPDRAVYVEFPRSNYQPGTPGYGKTQLSWRLMPDGPGKAKILTVHDTALAMRHKISAIL